MDVVIYLCWVLHRSMPAKGAPGVFTVPFKYHAHGLCGFCYGLLWFGTDQCTYIRQGFLTAVG